MMAPVLVVDIEQARDMIGGLRAFLERLKLDDDCGEEGLSIAELDDALALCDLLMGLMGARGGSRE